MGLHLVATSSLETAPRTEVVRSPSVVAEERWSAGRVKVAWLDAIEAWQRAVLLVVVHLALWLAVARARRRGKGLRPALVIGTQDRIEHLAHRLETFPEAGLRFAAGYSPTLLDSEAVEDGHAMAFSLLQRHK